MKTVKVSDLRLGDVVQCFDAPWGTGIVKKIGEDGATIFRPYGTTADFAYSGGVLCYVGTEEYTVSRNSEIVLYERKELASN
jgi:hypothetical protein